MNFELLHRLAWAAVGATGCYLLMSANERLARHVVLKKVRGWGRGRPFRDLNRALKAVQRARWLGAWALGGATYFWTDRFVLGLLVGSGALNLGPVWADLFRRWEARNWEDHAIPFLYSLTGLMQAGLGFSAALMALSRKPRNDLERELARVWSRFERGDSLETGWGRLKKIQAFAHIKSWWAVLEVAYEQGLPILPFLKTLVPYLEARQNLRHRQRQIRQEALAQGAVAWVIPWLLFGVGCALQPAVYGAFRNSSLFWPLLLVALGWELVGAALIWRSTCYLDR